MIDVSPCTYSTGCTGSIDTHRVPFTLDLVKDIHAKEHQKDCFADVESHPVNFAYCDWKCKFLIHRQPGLASTLVLPFHGGLSVLRDFFIYERGTWSTRWKSMNKIRFNSAFHNMFSDRASSCLTPNGWISLFERFISLSRVCHFSGARSCSPPQPISSMCRMWPAPWR